VDIMNLISRLTSMLLIIAALASCALPGAIVPNTTTADELLKKLGKPTDTRPHPQGGEFWEYAYGPEGTETWLFDVDRGRMVRSATQILTLERLHQVVPGVTTEAQVRDLLGKPRLITRFREETAWEWRVHLQPARGLYVVRFGRNGLATGINVLEDVTTDSKDRESGK
jgi:hypothetical protein